MSLPREWSFQTTRAYAASPLVGCSGTPPAARCYPAQNFTPDNSIESHALNKDPFTEVQVDLGGSLFSIHSAPVIELNSDTDSLKRPSSLVIQASEINTRSVDRDICSHISPPETVEDEENDNLLTISSLTARPLIAKSHELRSSKLSKKHRSKSYKYKNRTDSEGVIVPPDGGYGWAVVFGAFLVQFWVAGLVKSYGVLFVEVMETFRGSSAAVASWIPAILSALCLALAPLTSALCQKFSCRGVVFIGGLFCALGLTISYFATSLVHLFFTFGVLTGIGGGLSTTPGIVMVSQYFDKHRALANGICVSGTAAGSFVFPLLIEHLCATFGFHGTLLLLGGCMLHVCVSATLYRPLKAKIRQLKGTTNTQFLNTPASDPPLPTNNQLELLFQNDAIVTSGKNDTKARNNLLNDLFHQNAIICDPAKLSDSEEEKDQVGETVFMKPSLSFRSSSILHSVEDLSTDSTCVYKARQRDSLSKSMLIVSTADHNLYGQIHKNVEAQPSNDQTSYKKKTISQRISQYLDLSLLKDVNFIMMCLSVTLMSTGSPYMLYYLPAYVLSAGFTKTEAGYLVAISAALDLCGRLGLGWLSDLQLFDRRKGYIGSILGAGVAVLVIPVSRSFYVLACSVGMYGLCLGCWFLLVPVLLADQYGTEKISSSYGLVRMFQSVGAISVPPLAGYMRDVTGGYEYCFYCMGTCMVLGGVPLLLVPNNTGLDAESGKIFSSGSKSSAETNLH